MQDLEVEGHQEVNENKVPLLHRVEVAAIISEGLVDFFDEELGRVVGNISCGHLYMLTSSLIA